MKSLCSIFVIVILIGCNTSNEESISDLSNDGWELIYQNDFNGNPIFGNKDNLIESIKLGSPIRVSWGGEESNGSKWLHFAEPNFLTIMNDTTVVVQFPKSLIQTHYTNPEKTFLKTNPVVEWRSLMRTDGTYHQFHYELHTDKILKEMYSKTNISWFSSNILGDTKKSEILNLTPKNSFKIDSTIIY